MSPGDRYVTHALFYSEIQEVILLQVHSDKFKVLRRSKT
jgi:hypothetical protein